MVTIIKKEVEVAKETDEVMTGLVNIAKASKDALADGWQIGTDLPVILMSAATNLLPAVQGMDQVGAEWEAKRKEMLNAILLGASELVDILLPPKPVVAPDPAV